MGVRENKIEKLLDLEFTRLGGLTRKWVSPGRDGVPDRVCILNGQVWFIEVKTLDGVVSPAQEREHQRLRDTGANVRVLFGHVAVSEFIRSIENEVQDLP